MNWILWIYAISALASALAAVLAWAAKLWWAKEFSAAKDETIKAKEAQITSLKSGIENVQMLANETAKAKDAQIETLKNEIENLRDLTPMKIREYFLSMKLQLEEFNDALKQQLDKAHIDLEQKADEINNLRIQISEMADPSLASANQHKLIELNVERKQLERETESLESELNKIREEKDKAETILKISPSDGVLELQNRIRAFFNLDQKQAGAFLEEAQRNKERQSTASSPNRAA